MIKNKSLFALLIFVTLLGLFYSCGEKSAQEQGKNQTLETIFNRKSVRTYKDRPVEEEKIDLLLKAAMSAPSGMDKRPWHFVVVQDRDRLDKMAEGLPYAKMLKTVNQAIVVCGDSAKSSYWYLDCSTAAQNILLAAEALDLGAVWTAAYPYKDRMDVIRQNLQIPDSIQPLCVIPFGYPANPPQPKNKYDEKVIHRNTY